MFTLKRRLLAVTVLAVLAFAQILPVSAGYTSFNYSYCSGYGATNMYATYTSATTYDGGVSCWKYLQMHYYVPEAGYYYGRPPKEGWGPSVDDWINWPTTGWSGHLLGPSEWNNGYFTSST